MHRVTPEEVEDVCFGVHVAIKQGRHRYILSGQIGGGRYLDVVVEHMREGLFRAITAFEMSDAYKRRYRKRRE